MRASFFFFRFTSTTTTRRFNVFIVTAASIPRSKGLGKTTDLFQVYSARCLNRFSSVPKGTLTDYSEAVSVELLLCTGVLCCLVDCFWSSDPSFPAPFACSHSITSLEAGVTLDVGALVYICAHVAAGALPRCAEPGNMVARTCVMRLLVLCFVGTSVHGGAHILTPDHRCYNRLVVVPL